MPRKAKSKIKSNYVGVVLAGYRTVLRNYHDITAPLGAERSYIVPLSIQEYGKSTNVERMIFGLMEYELLLRHRPHVTFAFYNKGTKLDGMLFCKYEAGNYQVDLYEVEQER